MSDNGTYILIPDEAIPTLKSGAKEIQASTTDTVNFPWEWLGSIQWPTTNVIPVAIAIVLTVLALRGYQLDYNYKVQDTVTRVKFGPKKNARMVIEAAKISLADEGSSGKVDGEAGPEEKLEASGVPKKVIDDWNAAVQAAAKYGPINLGVKDI